MLKLMFCLLSFAFAADAPFWKIKPKVYERIENGEVIVSVNSTKNVFPESPRHLLKTNGGGQVAAPCDFVFQAALKYEEVAKLSGYITQAKFDSTARTMDLTISAFFYSSHMKVGMKATSPPAPQKIDFMLLSGPMKGYEFQMSFTEALKKKCEIGMVGTYRYDEFPIPRIFLEFGIESMLQGLAKRLRSHVEERWTRSP